MQNDVIKQWTEMSKVAVDALQQMTSANAEAMSQLIHNQFNSKNLGDVIKAAVESAKEFREINTQAFNTLLQKQLGMVNLNSSADSVKELGEIGNNAMTKFVEQQTALLNTYVETNRIYLDAIKDAKNPQDLVAAQTKMFTELQAQMKSHTMQTLTTLEALKSAISTWSSTMQNNAK
ncbi:phasin family protein [Thioflexithrix psekupsensis]|uniref:Phasin domain-containing protein n=1 Tax=Thioflexithrix psekupsensis TaxID=1570016 RepID=A0A251X587_9GAMM|nr:phasin family protein [Thioflexithrix psekupsensis]OUD12369.1 hypothetical protein TPSD3_14760 [Thioflexithrix psekupsensis]